MNLNVIIALLFGHFLGDFVFQSDRLALGKSKDSGILAQHVLVYIGVMTLVISLFDITSPMYPLWAIFNYFLHFVTDFISSRITSKLWASKKNHWFFVTIGADQLVHYLCLFGTWRLMA